MPTLGLPRLAGTYVLMLGLPRLATIGVGRLGHFQFPVGWYAYAGSAHGPGGLAARISRHLRVPKPLHWHVDYLRQAASEVAPAQQPGRIAQHRRRRGHAGRRLGQLRIHPVEIARVGAHIAQPQAGLGQTALPLIAFLACREHVGDEFDGLIARLGRTTADS